MRSIVTVAVLMLASFAHAQSPPKYAPVLAPPTAEEAAKHNGHPGWYPKRRPTPAHAGAKFAGDKKPGDGTSLTEMLAADQAEKDKAAAAVAPRADGKRRREQPVTTGLTREQQAHNDRVDKLQKMKKVRARNELARRMN